MRVAANASLLYVNGRFADLDAFVARYATLQDRFDDGRFKLIGINWFFDETIGMARTDGEAISSQLARWTSASPKSPAAAIATAAAWRNAAWRARGSGYSNTVSQEGWRLFHERMQRALGVLKESEAYAASNPLWYSEYMQANLGLDVPLDQQLALYRSGVRKFPEFFPLHFQMMVALLPQWHGSYQLESAFIDRVTAESPVAQRAEIYARLWWYAGQVTDPDVDIFRDMGASWPRMKQGFESLITRFPRSQWNRSNYAMFACRARDMNTYIKLRAKLDQRIVVSAFPANLSIDVCDARAAGKAT
jgi:hypothetical protein